MERYFTERKWWGILQAPDRESAAHKARLDSNASIFRDNLRQAGGFRRLLAAYAALGRGQIDVMPEHYRPLARLHPRAAQMLVDHGVEYRPLAWEQPPHIEPDIGSCYVNSFRYMAAMNHAFRSRGADTRLAYVEGISLSQSAGLHAWNAFDTKTDLAIDTSWYAMTAWYFYFGLPLTEVEYRNVRRRTHPDRKCNLLRRDVFPRAEEHLAAVLADRKPRPPASS